MEVTRPTATVLQWTGKNKADVKKVFGERAAFCAGKRVELRTERVQRGVRYAPQPEREDGTRPDPVEVPVYDEVQVHVLVPAQFVVIARTMSDGTPKPCIADEGEWLVCDPATDGDVEVLTGAQINRRYGADTVPTD